MPYYDYRCLTCGRAARIFIAYSEYDSAHPECPHCASRELKRRVTRVAFGRSEETRLESMMDDPSLSGLDEEDPRALGRFMRKMSCEMGEDLGDEFNEVVGRLEQGESPESIEESTPGLSDNL